MDERVEAILKANLEENKSCAHGLGHLQRTAEWSFWFVTQMDGTLREAELAYVAGLFHDMVRPDTNEIWHAQDSANKTKELLKDIYQPNDLEKIVKAVLDHCEPKKEWESLLHQAPFFADKIAEGSGAYVCLREALWSGESPDYHGKDLVRFVPHLLRKRVDGVLRPTNYPSRFSKLVEYQNQWILDFSEALEKNDSDAVFLLEFFNKRGKEGLDFDSVISEAVLQKIGEFGGKCLTEAMHYVRGGKQSQFESLIQR